MINKNYLKYLFKSKKYFLIFIVLIQVVLCISSSSSSFNFNNPFTTNVLFWGYLVGLILAFTMPIIVFSYVHNKKAIDTYYPLNMSRKEMLGTGVLFSLLVSLMAYLATIIAAYCLLIFMGRESYALIAMLWTIPLAILNYLMVIVFNTAIYLLANTLFDGIVILGAYSLLSLALYVLVVTFQDTFLIGTNILSTGLSSDVLVYLSPVVLSVMSNLSLSSFLLEGGLISDYTLPIYLIVIILYLVVFGYILYKEYINRQTERAGNYSNEFFAYPFVIGLYTVMCLLFIACQTNIMSNLSETIILFVVVFALYVIANFVYKRKFSISFKQILLFILAIAISVVFNIVSVNTKGFGLSEIYEFDYEKMSYTLTAYPQYDDNSDEIYDFIKSIDDEYNDDSYYEVCVEVHSTNKEVVDIMENYRRKAIDNFYENDFGRYNDVTYSSLSIRYDEKNARTYTCPSMSVSDFKKILELDSKNVIVSYTDYVSNETKYIIYENGEYKTLSDAGYSIYNYYDYQTAAELEESFTKAEEVTSE